MTRVFELREEIQIFLNNSNFELSYRLLDFSWLAKLAYLGDIFSILNSLNISLQEKTLTIVHLHDKIKALLVKLDLWCARLDRHEFDSFTTLHEFLVSSEAELDGNIVGDFKSHLTDMNQQLAHYFPEL